MNDNDELFLRNNEVYLEAVRSKITGRLVFTLDPVLRKRFADVQSAEGTRERLAACTEALNALQDNSIWWLCQRLKCAGEDIRVFLQQIGRRKCIDNSGKGNRDYYSIVLVAKDEARYIRELILFYKATGADRIYLYDNDSSDNLMEEIEPFLVSGFVVYRKYPGHKIQTAAYRDAVRRTRDRTKWLAIVDCDEFLFSPKGAMPEQLKRYEKYPGIGVNWVVFGPNGHDRRPEGLVMDNYTTTPADNDVPENCQIKSIVQPKEVVAILSPHFAYYRGKGYAVDEDGGRIDNRNAFVSRFGRAFTARNHREVFRINHYATKSMEDLEMKCKRGFPDGNPNPVPEDRLKYFRTPMKEDLVIRPYADIVRMEK